MANQPARGGGCLHEISRPIRSMRNLSDYIKDRGWDYVVWDSRSATDEACPILDGKPLLITKRFISDRIDGRAIRDFTGRSLSKSEA